jgi:AraC family transcriptional regulator
MAADQSHGSHRSIGQGPSGKRVILPGVEVRREDRIETFLRARPTLSSTTVGWAGLVVEDHSVPACVIDRHEHLQNFVHVVLRGSVKYEVLTRGKTLEFVSSPGTTFILPRGTVDELRWKGSTHRLAVAIHPSLLTNASWETSGTRDIELTEHWDLMDPNIMAVLLAMTTDLNEGSPTGRLYGEALANALAVYLLGRYTVQLRAPVICRGGLTGYRLKRVLDHIGDNVASDLSLSELAAVAGMSPHYFAELFRRTTGSPPHRYVLLRRIELAKDRLSDPSASVIEAGLGAGFQNPSHFARVFRKIVGVSPSEYRSEILGDRR